MTNMDGYRNDPEWRDIAVIINDIKNTLIKIPYDIEEEYESEEAT